jgi:hypothetical protein
VFLQGIIVLPNILSRVWVTKSRFGLLSRCIGSPLVVTTINYNSVTDFHTTKYSTLISTSLH